MLEGYYPTGESRENKQRLLAVQAALEIVKASAGSAGANARTDKVEEDLKYASKELKNFADAIQAALK
ncbi:hypothetical protein [Rahnella sp. Larv3_ips]|uniref:hypothetical protein n=1 Tax=Rahnella sp. Larv3_ips TaxID=1896943 RepID=UPI000EFA4C35|nr:hypothetical protein [Rahnella sp. Larv3_ips]